MCNATHSKNDLKTGRTDYSQLKTEDYIKKGGRGRDTVANQTPGVATHK